MYEIMYMFFVISKWNEFELNKNIRIQRKFPLYIIQTSHTHIIE